MKDKISEENRKIGRKISALTFSLVMVLAIFASVPLTQAAASRTYTIDADFDEGTLVGVEHTTVHDQLQLSKTTTTLPFIWTPNSGQGTVSKVDTQTGKELGRYWVAPTDKNLPANGNPSRTTVDLQGNVWVGNRQAGTVVKIGLDEAGQCTDRNGNGTIETSADTNNDGDITGAELLPWGQDECVLYEVVLIPGQEGTFVPGTYPGSYDTNYWGTAPRGLAIDAQNNLWAGTSQTYKYYHINGATGQITQTVDVSQWGGNGAYGATIDKNAILWSAILGSGILRMNTVNTADQSFVSVGHTYGIGLDFLGHLFDGGGSQLSKIDTSNSAVLWTKPAKAVRGVVATSDNNVWVAGYDQNGNYAGVTRYDNDGNQLAVIGGFNAPSGVAVDSNGKVWVTDIGSDNIYRIDPTTNTIDLTKTIVGSGGHYTYSDMTGFVARSITTKIGTWTIDYDSGTVDTQWGTVSWNSNEPAGTSVTVRVRSSNDKVTWSAWEIVTNGVPLSSTPNGRYLQVDTTLQITSGEESPILYDLTVSSKGGIEGYMTGGGSVFTADGKRVTHGFELNCNKTKTPNNLEINWGKGNKFHLDTLDTASCSDDPAIVPNPPPAGFDTYKGTGTGNYNGIAGAKAEWTFTDAGEPGKEDTATIQIKDVNGNVVLTVSGKIQNGNQQAHKPK